MTPHSIIIDDFLTDFQGWRQWADTLTYDAVINPFDSVTYPGIFKSVPQWGIRQRIEAVMRCPIELKSLFLRLSLKDVPVPHQAHCDVLMGQFSCMLYMNRPEHCQGGTELVRHESGMDRTPVDDEGLDLWERDTNDSSKWNVYSTCEMKPNRAFIFDANLMHRAAPLGGFGDTTANGRLVMTAFFNIS